MKRVAVGLLVPVGGLVIYSVSVSNLWSAALAVVILGAAVAILAGKE